MQKTMISLSKVKPGRGMDLVHKPIPSIEEHEILIQIKVASICGTDLHIYTWDAWAANRLKNLPQTMGHELAGIVVKVGSRVKRVKIGDHVSCETHIVCGECEFCRTGQGHICVNTQILGVDRDGAFAEYIAVPAENAWINDKSVPFEYTSLQEPLGNAVHTVLSGPVVGKSVAIVGVGPIGMLAVDVAKAAGARAVYAIDINEYRLNLAHSIGADACINSLKEDVVQRVLDLTEGLGVDVVCEMSGNGKALNQALEFVKCGGRVSILGVPTKNVEIDVAKHIVFKGIQIYGITGRRMYDTWYQVKGLVESGKLHLKELVTHVMPYTDYEKAFLLMESGQCGKIVLMFNQEVDQ